MKTGGTIRFGILLLLSYCMLGATFASTHISVPFVFDGRITMSLKVNNSEIDDIVLDTGVGQSIMLIMHEETGRELELEYTETQDIIRGAGTGKNKAAHLSPNVKASISSLDLGSIFTAVVAEGRQHSSHNNKGVIGGALFSSYVVEIDFDTMTLSLHDPDPFQPSDGWTELPITLERNMPVIQASIFSDTGEEIAVKLLVDTGAQPTLALSPEKNPKIQEPRKVIHSLSGTGLRGDTYANKGRLPGLKIGPHRFTKVLSHFIKMVDFPPLEELPIDGLVGIGTLYRFNMIFDYSRKRMLIKPNRHASDPFEMNMAGMVIKKMGTGHTLVYHVDENTPASKIGLQKGDVIKGVNGKNIDTFDYLELKKLFEKPGAALTIQVDRDGKHTEFKLNLVRLI